MARTMLLGLKLYLTGCEHYFVGRQVNLKLCSIWICVEAVGVEICQTLII